MHDRPDWALTPGARLPALHRGDAFVNENIVLTHGQVIGFLRRGFLLALLVSATLGVALYQWQSQAEPAFRAQAILVTQGSQVDLRTLGLPGINQAPLHVDAYRVAASSGPVLAAALESLGLPSTPSAVNALRQGGVQIEARPASQMLEVSVTSSTPERAADLANAIAAQIEIWDRDRLTAELQRMAQLLTQRITVQQLIVQELEEAPAATQVQAAQLALTELRGQLDSIVSLSTNSSSAIKVVRAATPPSSGLGRSPLMFGLLGLILGALLAYGLMFVLELFNGRLYGADSVERATNLPVLASIPRLSGRFWVGPDVAVTLQANLGGSIGGARRSALLVTGAGTNDDTAAAAMAVAESFARRGLETLLIDADLEAPAIAKGYRVPGINALPLLACARGEQGARLPLRVSLGNGARLALIYDEDASAEDIVTLLNGLPACIDRWKSEFQAIVIRGAPILKASDSLILSESCDGIILAINTSRVNRRRALAAVERLRRSYAPLLGIIMTGERGRSARQSEVRAQLPKAASSVRRRTEPPQPY